MFDNLSLKWSIDNSLPIVELLVDLFLIRLPSNPPAFALAVMKAVINTSCPQIKPQPLSLLKEFTSSHKVAFCGQLTRSWTH